MLSTKASEHIPVKCGNMYCELCQKIGFTWNKKVKIHEGCTIQGCSVCWQINRNKYWASRCYDKNYETIDG